MNKPVIIPRKGDKNPYRCQGYDVGDGYQCMLPRGHGCKHAVFSAHAVMEWSNYCSPLHPYEVAAGVRLRKRDQ